MDHPPPGAGLEQWKVEASGLAGDLRQLSHGTIVSFSPPDDYRVEWSDGSTTCYGYSHLFSAGRLPLVLPVPPAQWASYEAAPLESTQQPVRGCSSQRPQRPNARICASAPSHDLAVTGCYLALPVPATACARCSRPLNGSARCGVRCVPLGGRFN